MSARTEIETGTPKVGLALSGGAARGIAHIGVLRVLEEYGIRIDCIAGTSAGALVGGAYASGVEVGKLAEIASSMKWRDVGRIAWSRLGVQSNEPFEEFLRGRLPVTRFEDLRYPFAAVATDLMTGSPVVLSHEGDVAFAIRASCTIPGLYVPVTDAQGRQLVDGGLVANIPSGVARALGATVVIAVDVNAEGAKFLGQPQSAFGVILQSIMVVQRTAAVHQLNDADVVIRPRVGHIRWDELARASDLIEAGEEAARRTIPRIKRLIEAAAEPKRRWFSFRGRRKRSQREELRKLSPLA